MAVNQVNIAIRVGAVGGGMSYGYQFILGRYWNLELNIGVGYARLKYDKYECRTCGEKVGTETKDYLGTYQSRHFFNIYP